METLNKVLIVLVIALTFTSAYFYVQNNDLKRLIDSNDIEHRKEVWRARKHVSDSLIKHFESLPHDTVIKNQIQYKYDTIVDSILVLPNFEQLRYITDELNRLYPDEQDSTIN